MAQNTIKVLNVHVNNKFRDTKYQSKFINIYQSNQKKSLISFDVFFINQYHLSER